MSAVIHEIDASSIVAAAQGSTTTSVIPPEIVAAVKSEVNSLFWSWYDQHVNDHVVTVHFWLFSKNVKVSDLQQVFVLLFGAPGENMAATERPPATLSPSSPDHPYNDPTNAGQ